MEGFTFCVVFALVAARVLGVDLVATVAAAGGGWGSLIPAC